MTASASDGWAAFTRRGLTLWLPASVNLGIASLLAPAMNALLARADDPEASIAGFSVALGVITIVALPQFRIQQLTLVFLHDQRALRSLRRFVVITAAVVGAISCAAALTPLAELILEGIFAATGDLLTQARAALVALCPLPVFMVARTHLHGAALRLGQARLVWLGTGLGAGGAVAVSAGLIAAGMQGAAAAGVGTTLAAGLETVMLMAATRNLLRHGLPAHSPRGLDSSLGAVARFFTPLIFASLLPAATTPIVNAALARTSEPETSLAAFAIAIGLFQFLTILLWGAQPSILALLARGERHAPNRRLDQRRRRRLVLIASAGRGVRAAVESTGHRGHQRRPRPAGRAVAARSARAGAPAVDSGARAGVRLGPDASAAHPPDSLRQPVAARRAARLRGAGAQRLEGLPGVAVGAGAWAASLIVEAAATYAYGRGAYRQLKDRRGFDIRPLAHRMLVSTTTLRLRRILDGRA